MDSRQNFVLPEAPRISEGDLEKCRKTGDFSPVLFEWYKFVAGLCVTFSNLLRESPIVRDDISDRDYAILIGLMNRVYRLMLANIALSHEGEFGESTSILDRCIFETSVILSWLCASGTQDGFDRYIASGLRTELEVAEQVNAAIEKRGTGEILQIERRMLDSVSSCLDEAGFDAERIRNTKVLPDLAAMLTILGHERFSYTAGQRIGSHHVHGTWVGLRYHYLELGENGTYRARQKSYTHENQYVYISNIVLSSIADFVNFVLLNAEEDRDAILALLEKTEEQISKLNEEIVGSDFNVAK